MANFKKIKSLDELKKICDGNPKCFFIQLNFGLRSSKTISYDSANDKFHILNEIDDTEQVLDSKDIMDANITNVGAAIVLGSFYQY